MKKSLLASLLSMSIAVAMSPVANASSANYQEKESIGFGSGLIVGGLVGGPIGAVVAAIGGTLVGHNMAADEEVVALSTQVTQQQQQLAQLNLDNESLLAQVQQAAENEQQLRQVSFQQPVTGQAEHSLMMAFQFRTGSAQVESLYSPQLSKLARAIKQLPDMQIELSGYADSRGDERYNENLSAQRAEAVKDKLVALGVSPERFITNGHGEAQATAESAGIEALFFDRRVVLTLIPAQTQTAATDY